MDTIETAYAADDTIEDNNLTVQEETEVAVNNSVPTQAAQSNQRNEEVENLFPITPVILGTSGIVILIGIFIWSRKRIKHE